MDELCSCMDYPSRHGIANDKLAGNCLYDVIGKDKLTQVTAQADMISRLSDRPSALKDAPFLELTCLELTCLDRLVDGLILYSASYFAWQRFS